MNPYLNPVEKISDVTPYFKKDPKTSSMTFIGESLELRIPLSFKKHGAITIGDTVTTPGVLDMIINDKYRTGLNILASITIEPSDISEMTYNGVEYLVLKLKNGDKFMSSYRVIRDSQIVYVLWTEWITNGNVGYWLTYDDLLKLFNNVEELTGSGIGVSRSVYEGIISHIARDKNNLALQYRLTDMKKPMRLVALNSVSHAPTGALARINGAYFRDAGMTSALRYRIDQTQPFEDLLRGIPTTRTNEVVDNAAP
jgi:hypothetical protein